MVASALAAFGVGLVVKNGLGEGSVYGDALALAMTVFMAAAIVIVRRATVTIPMVPAACLSALLSCFVSLPFAAPMSATPIDLGYLVIFGASNMGLGLILFTSGARLIPAAQTALIGVLDAPLAPIWVWLAFGEVPKLSTIVGGSVVLFAVVGHILYETKKLEPHAC
jgi:drug/metabolite transporter (DMT)-like permease